MKNYITILLVTLISTIAWSQSGIQFESGDWEAALKKARTEGKVIFVDAYTTWCGPCKMMAKNTFTDAAVGDYFNENFVNMKIDMEKGEGILFAKAYGVRAYPTYVFVDDKGRIAHKGLGYMESNDFIELGKAAGDEENRFGALKMRYDKGEDSPEFLKQYATVLNDVYDESSGDVAAEYLATQSDWSSPENAEFVVQMLQAEPNSELFQYAMQNRTALSKNADGDLLDNKLKGGVMREIQVKEMDEAQQKAYYKQVFNEKGAEYYDEYQMRKYSRLQDDEMKKNYLEATTNYLTKYDVEDWGILNHAAWNFYEISDDKKQLKLASQWALKSIKDDSNYMNNDTAAALFYKLGDKKQAISYANEAIRLAKENGQDYKSTEELLEKIEAL